MIKAQKKTTAEKITIGIAADHGGFELKELLVKMLLESKYEVVDFGNSKLENEDDYPDFVIPLAKAVAAGDAFRGIAICGSGVGASIVANKVAGVRAALIQDYFASHQGVEDDDMNLLCLGGRTIGYASAEELVLAFLNAEFIGAERHLRRLRKVQDQEKKQ